MDFTERLAELTPAEMRKAFANRKRKLPEKLVNDLIANERARRRTLHPVRKKREQHIRLWKNILDPAVYELRNVRRMLSLKLAHPTLERTAALEAYTAVIELVINKLQVNIDKLRIHEDKIDDDLFTPGQQASKATPAFPYGKPNGGTHWVDYVPVPVIKKIRALFEAIPKTKHARQKEPFPVTFDRTTSAKRRIVLLDRTRKELEHLERRIAAELADPRLKDTSIFKHQEIDAMRVQASSMQSAMHLIGQLPPNAFIPPTWHGILTERTYPGQHPRGAKPAKTKEVK